jgi:biopolymer transport protein ExbD
MKRVYYLQLIACTALFVSCNSYQKKEVRHIETVDVEEIPDAEVVEDGEDVKVECKDVTLSVKDCGDGKCSFHVNGGASISFDELEAALVKEMTDKGVSIFCIHADETVSINDILKVMNIAKKNHFKLWMSLY